MNLVIVESPTKAKTLRKFLGDNYAIEASMGHIRDLPKSTIGIDIKNDFTPEYVKSEGKSKTISVLKKLAATADRIYLATDPDREGEAISWHIQQILEEGATSKKQREELDKKFVRSTFHEITKSAIQEAIDHPGVLNMDMVDAQQARRVVDRLVGYYLSPVLWKKVRRGLSAGRVQSVALRLIVEREKEILAFIPEEYWEVNVTLKDGASDQSFAAALWKVGANEFIGKKKEDVDPILADLETAGYLVQAIQKTERKRTSLAPFTTSTLQQAASNKLGFSSKKTMKLAQDLYEQGLITYHRTDSVNLAASAVESARTYIQSTFGPEYLPATAKVFATKSKNAQEAHEAIRPTAVEKQAIEQSDRIEVDHQRLYDLIYRRFVACQMTDARYDQTAVIVEASNNGKSYFLKANGSILLFDGWMKLFPDRDDVLLPAMEVGAPLTKEAIEALQKFTQPKPRYNDASLVKTSKKLGIGRPSTYASIISVLETRGYVERVAKAFQPTSVGITVADFLVLNFPTELEYSFTASMEDDLDAISRGEKKWVDVIKNFFGPFEKNVGRVSEEALRAQVPVEEFGEACPLCTEGKLVIRTGRFGKFISCSRYPECTFTGKLIQKVQGIVCPECGQGEIRLRKSAKGREFFGCSKYPTCRFSTWNKPGTDENPIILTYVPNPPKVKTDDGADVKKESTKSKTTEKKKAAPKKKTATVKKSV